MSERKRKEEKTKEKSCDILRSLEKVHLLELQLIIFLSMTCYFYCVCTCKESQ